MTPDVSQVYRNGGNHETFDPTGVAYFSIADFSIGIQSLGD